MPDRITADMSPFAKKLGIVCDHVEDDRAVYSMAFDEDNVTIGDVVHGGAICSLADVAATGAAWSTITEPGKYRGITIDLSLSFIGAARSSGIVADATVVKRGGTVCFVDVELRSTDGRELIARCKVVYKLSKVESPQDQMTALFAGKPLDEQMRLLATLERGGADLYRAFAAQEKDEVQRRAMLQAAEREEANAVTLESRRPSGRG